MFSVFVAIVFFGVAVISVVTIIGVVVVAPVAVLCCSLFFFHFEKCNKCNNLIYKPNTDRAWLWIASNQNNPRKIARRHYSWLAPHKWHQVGPFLRRWVSALHD